MRSLKASHALAAIIFAGTIASVGSEANAGVILAGDSNGSTFSGCVGCASGSTSTSLLLSKFTLDIDPMSFNVPGDTTGVILAELKLITANNPSGSATFNYNLLLNFTTPVSTASDTFNFSMSASGSGANSDEQLSGLNLTLPDPLVLSGVTLSNFRFVDTNSDTTGTFGNAIWDVSGHQGAFATLDLVADVTATSTPTSTPVPEPTSLAVLGTGLVGLGLIRRRRNAKV